MSYLDDVVRTIQKAEALASVGTGGAPKEFAAPVIADRTTAILESVTGKKKDVFSPTVVTVPEEKKTAADKLWDRGAQPLSAATQAKMKANSAKKKLEDYQASDEYKQAAEERYKQAEQKQKEQNVVNLFMGKDPSFSAVQPEADPVETRLKAEYDQAQAEADALENEEVMVSDLEAITGLSNEERQLLEQYAVNQVRDQNLPVEMVGKMPTAQQEASALIEKYGKQRVDELAESYMRQKNAEQAKTVEEQSREFANDHGVIGSVLTVPVAAASGVVGTVGQLQGAARNTGRYSTLDPNATGTIGDVFTGAVRGQVAQNIEGEDPTLLRKGLSIGYQGVMSAADSIARAYLGGGAFGGAALAATGSFSQTMADASRQGATPAQAALLATVNSGIEALSEKIPLDDLIDVAKGTGAKNVIYNVLRQMGIEATTEEVSLIGTMLTEAAVLKEKSGYNQTVTTQLLMGKSLEEARKAAAEEIWDEAVNTALVSAVSGIGGGVSASVYAARNAAPELDTASPNLSAEQMAQEAIANNRARHDAMAAEEAAQPVQQPETAAQPQQPTKEAQPVQPVQQAPTQPKTAQEVVDEILTGNQNNATQNAPQTAQDKQKEIVDLFVNPNKGNAAATEAASEVNGNPANDSDYRDEFENWGADPNREGVEDPLAGRNHSEVGKRNVKAYMYENPAVKPFYQEQAAWLLSELNDTTKGERTYNEQLHYESGGEQGWTGTKRQTSDSIAQLLDESGMTYDQIEKGLTAIINDNGQENNAVSKRIEFIINDRLMNGYTDFYTGKRVSGNAEYLNLLRNQQSTPTTDMQTDASNQSAEGGQIKGTGAAEQNFTGKAAYQDLLYEGNVQRDRAGDVRPVEVPKTDTEGRKVSETVGNFYGAAITSDEMAGHIESLVQDGALSYDSRTNKQSLENAASAIQQRGEESVRTAIAQNVGQKKIQDGDIEKALLLYAKDASNPERQEAAAEMMVQLQEMATMSGRNLQLFRLVRRMTPEGRLMNVQKEVRSSAEKMIKSGAVKKDFEPVVDPELEQEYLSAARDAQSAKSDQARQEAEQSMQELQNAIHMNAAAKMPATFKAKWDAWRYMAMLGNAKTQVRNFFGNLAFKPYKEVKDKMGALVEMIFVPKGQRTKSLVTDRDLVKLAKEDARTQSVNDALKYSAKLGDDVSSQKIRENMQVFKSKAVDGVRKFVEAVPGAGDMLFKNNYYARSLAGFLKARGYTAADVQNDLVSQEVMGEARSYAIQEAMKATFNDSNAFSDFLATGLRYKGDNPIGKALNIAAEGVLPFRRTPANIAVRFTEYSPVGVAKGLWNAASKVRKGEMTAATAIDQITSGLTGSAVMALGFALAGGLNGIKITGSGTDEDEKRQGHQDYALEFSVDGQEYSYKIDWAAPANLPLFVGANIYSALENAGEDTDVSKFTSFIRGMGTMFEPLLALSCMSSLNDLVEGVRYADEGEALYTIASQAATSYFTQGIPSLARQVTQALTENKQTTFTTSDDPTIRDLQSTAAGLGVGNAYKTDKVNAWGETESQGEGVERAVNAFLNPGTLKQIDNSDVEQEITRLNAAGQDVTPDTFAKTVSYIDKDGTGHDDVRLTEEQYQTLAQTQGQTARKLLEDMVKSDSYKGMTDEQKADAIKTAYQYARMTGEIAAIEDHTGYDQSWMYDVEKGGANEIIRRTLNSGINTAMDNLDNAWDKGYDEKAFAREMETMFRSYQNVPAAMKKKVYAEATGTAKKYIEVRDNGISHSDALAAIENVAKAKGTGSINKETGKATVRDIDRRQAIANTPGLTEKGIDTIMKAYMADYDPSDESPETTEFKYQYAREELGLSPKEYADTYRAYLDNSRKAQKIAAIRELGYDYQTANALYKLYYGRMKNDLIEMYG